MEAPKKLRVLIACEFSGVVRDAFAKRGHDAWSCDILPSESEGNHYQCDVLKVLSQQWDLIIAHPPCTYLANSGVRWLYPIAENQKRWRAMQEAALFFRLLMRNSCNKIAIENPIPHKWALEKIHKKYDQIVQPWQFGHGETKATCLWLKNLPLLQPTNIVEGREGKIWKMPPGPDRAKNRSRTYQGIADAMAEQWGAV